MSEPVTNGTTYPVPRPPDPAHPLTDVVHNLDLKELMLERGTSGLHRAGGFIREDLLIELSGLEGVRRFKDMRDNSAVVGACLYAVEMRLRNVRWRLTPVDTSEEAQRYAKIAEGMLFDDLELPWSLLMSEILSFLPFGWSYHEMVLKRRQGLNPPPFPDGTPALPSKFHDGYIGLGKLSLRSQDSLLRWEIDQAGSLLGMHQLDPWAGRQAYIPYEKALLFRPTSYKNSPEGRALDPSTPIPTPDGWRLLDDLEPGSKVFDEQGRIRYVTARQDWDHRPCYALRFQDGTEIIADAEHQWLTQTHYERNKAHREGCVRTTTAIVDTLKTPNGSNHRIAWANPLDYPRQCLPLDPYYFGLWLGDGHARNGKLTCHADDADAEARLLEKRGFTVRISPNGTTGGLGRSLHVYGGTRWAADNPSSLLRRMGVLQNKHIPESYLRGAVPQRRDLLAGLMDSDGTVDKDGRCEFVNTNMNLIQGVAELVRSLGCGVSVGLRHRANGTDHLLDSWCVKFTPPWSPFLLPRKAARIKDTRARMGHYIVAARPVPPRRTVCIEVEGPSHLFLAGEAMIPTHNSILRTAYRAWYMVKNIENTEAIGAERDLAGLPVFGTPPQWWLASASPEEVAQLELVRRIGRNIRQDEQACLVYPLIYDPAGNQLFKFELAHSGGAKAIDTDTIIQRYELRITQSMLCDLLFMGHEDVGSFALASSKSTTEAVSLGGYLAVITDEFNRRCLPLLWRLNGFPDKFLPTLAHGDVETLDLTELARFMLSFGRIFNMQDLENPLRAMAGLPEREGAETHPLPPSIQPHPAGGGGGASSHGGGSGTDIQSLGTGMGMGDVGLPDLDRDLSPQSLSLSMETPSQPVQKAPVRRRRATRTSY
jgi:hypothetical protein